MKCFICPLTEFQPQKWFYHQDQSHLEDYVGLNTAQLGQRCWRCVFKNVLDILTRGRLNVLAVTDTDFVCLSRRYVYLLA